jgi:hypothetical protein
MSFALNAALAAALLFGASVPAAAADALVRKAPVKATAGADRCAKLDPAPGTPSVPGGDLFGYTDGTDIGDPCSLSFSTENSARAGKQDGRYFALTSKNEIAYTYSNNVAFAFAAFSAYNRWSNVTVVQDALASEGVGVFINRYDKLNFDGLSGEVFVRLLTRSPGQPFAVTVTTEPRLSYVDFVTGYRADGYAAEFKLFVDVALTERLFAAMNLNYGLGVQKFDIPGAVWARGSAYNVSAALTAQVYAAEKQAIEAVYIGIEGRYRAVYNGLALDSFAGSAFNFGPTVAISFAGDRMLNIVWSPQLHGRVSPSTPGNLNLTHFERQEFRVKFATPIAP